MAGTISRVDVVGVGLNAMDTLIRVPHFPAVDTKVEILSVEVSPGGQVASAMLACSRWGLSARYVGTVGEDHAAQVHRSELENAGVETHLIRVDGCKSQSSFILIDELGGERTILWSRDARLELRPDQLEKEWVTQGRVLLVDGHDTRAAIQAAQWASEAGIPVVADIDNPYLGVEVLLENVNYLIGSQECPSRLSDETDLVRALPLVQRQYGCRVVAATLGKDGVLAWDGIRFYYAPAYRVRAVDTTGAGDIFHAAFIYSLLQGWQLENALDFCCAAAGLDCTAIGARGGIRPVAETLQLMREGLRLPSRFGTADLTPEQNLK